jgi:hypothetical protein
MQSRPRQSPPAFPQHDGRLAELGGKLLGAIGVEQVVCQHMLAQLV